MITVTFSADPLPSDFSGSLQDFQTKFLSNLRGYIEDTEVLIGQINGARPTTNIGPWLNSDTWYVWNGSQYVPTSIKVGGADYVVQLSNEYLNTKDIIPDKTQTLQDKDGTVALLTDVYEGRSAIVLSGTSPTIDWSLSKNFTQVLTGNTTYKISNSKDGQQVVVAVANGATGYTVSWPSSIFWTTISPPSQSGPNLTDLYVLYNIGGSVFGRQLAGYV